MMKETGECGLIGCVEPASAKGPFCDHHWDVLPRPLTATWLRAKQKHQAGFLDSHGYEMICRRVFKIANRIMDELRDIR